MYVNKLVIKIACLILIISLLHSIDATRDDGTFGRLINHSKRAPNVSPRITQVGTLPCLYFIALREIGEGEEIQYDYGDRTPQSVIAFPWLKE